MKVLAIYGSHNKFGVTYQAIKLIEEELNKEDIGVDMIHIGSEAYRGCTDCRYCRTHQRCAINDIVNEIRAKLPEYDGLILGTTTIDGGLPGSLKNVLDRLSYSYAFGPEWFFKPAIAIAACRRAASTDALNQLNIYTQQMIRVGSQYWNIVFGWKPEEMLEQDREGVQTMQKLGMNMAWMLKVLDKTKDIPRPDMSTPRLRSNFCNNTFWTEKIAELGSL